VAERLAAALQASGSPAERLYMGAGTPGLPTRRLRQAIRRGRPGGPRRLDAGRAHRIAELVHTWADFRWRDRHQIKPRLRQGITVVCDRYAYDLATWNLPRLQEERLLWLLRRFVRRPDTTIFLSAAPEVIRRRRDELSLEEISRQQARLRRLVDQTPGAVIVDASGSVDDIVQASLAALSADGRHST
jgi:thymidylate kinase